MANFSVIAVAVAVATVIGLNFFVSKTIIPIAQYPRKSIKADIGNSIAPIFGDNQETITPWITLQKYRKDQRQQMVDHANGYTFSMPDKNDWLLSQPFYDREPHYEKENQLIPKILHKVILINDGSFPESFTEILELMGDPLLKNTSSTRPESLEGSIQEAHLSWKEKNPAYEIRYYNLHYCRAYLKQFFHPLFLRAFDCVEAFAAKADFFRYLVVYRDGGFYSDWKQLCIKEGLLDWLSTDNTTWFSNYDKGLPKQSHAMQNNFFGATPRSPILAEAIITILRNIQTRSDLDPKSNPYSLLGPVVLGDAFSKMKGVQSDIRVGEFQAQWGMRAFYGGEYLFLHKCHGCGQSQNWTTMGNDYMEKHKIGEYFCPDASSLFLP